MTRVGFVFVFVLVTQILVLQALALKSEAKSEPPMSMELKTQREVQLSDQKTEKLVANHASVASSASREEGKSKAEEEVAEAPHNRRMGKHHSTDKSVAGGGVILGGLVTATFAAVFCYIRVTRKRDSGH